MERFLIRRGRADDRGATAAEYALLVALIAAVIVLSVAALGSGIRNSFRDSCRQIANATNTVGPC